ncbi:MAG: hypothetical protein O3B92_01445 [Actinobacteria bacterium]|nr:hypothetical protein [Actinomycetota bacterium]MDA3017664.1 hypothetical protein [Actinomycetota bacterium]
MKLVLSRFVLVLGMLVPVVTGCATTINESAPSTIANSTTDSNAENTISTIDPQLNRDELLTEMLQSVGSLSDAMQKSDRKLATKHLDQINLIDYAVRPKILEFSDQLAADFDRVVALAKSAVERNRPADADKALRFLPLIIDSLENS